MVLSIVAFGRRRQSALLQWVRSISLPGRIRKQVKIALLPGSASGKWHHCGRSEIPARRAWKGLKWRSTASLALVENRATRRVSTPMSSSSGPRNRPAIRNSGRSPRSTMQWIRAIRFTRAEKRARRLWPFTNIAVRFATRRLFGLLRRPGRTTIWIISPRANRPRAIARRQWAEPGRAESHEAVTERARTAAKHFP